MKTNFKFSSVQILGKMGCTKSKLDEKVCLKDETTTMHIAFFKQNGIQKYYEVMGVEGGSNHNSFEDHSSNLNLGLINIEQKSESDVENINTGNSVNNSTRSHQDHLQMLYEEKKEVPDEQEEDTQGSHAISDSSKPRDVSKNCDTTEKLKHK